MVFFAAAAAIASVVDGINAKKNADAQNRASAKRARLNRAAALESLLEQSFDVSLRALQESAQIGSATRAAERQGISQQGAITASAGSAGIAGQSVTDLLNTSKTATDRATGDLRLFSEFRDLANFRTLSNLRLQAKNRINAVQAQEVRAPSLFDSGLRAALGAGQGFQTDQAIKAAGGFSSFF